MLRRRGISVACTQTTRALLERGARCHQLLRGVTNGDRGGTSVGGWIVADWGSIAVVDARLRGPNDGTRILNRDLPETAG